MPTAFARKMGEMGDSQCEAAAVYILQHSREAVKKKQSSVDFGYRHVSSLQHSPQEYLTSGASEVLLRKKTIAAQKMYSRKSFILAFVLVLGLTSTVSGERSAREPAARWAGGSVLGCVRAVWLWAARLFGATILSDV